MSTGYGIEAWCADSYVSGRYSRGWMTVALSLFRRLITPRGMLDGGDEERNGGLDLSELVGAVGTARTLTASPGMVAAEFTKDDRVQPGGVSVAPSIATGRDGLTEITLEILVVLADEGTSFALTLRVDAVSTDLLGMRLVA